MSNAGPEGSLDGRDGVSLFACARCGGTLSRRAPGSIRVICRFCGATTVLEDGVNATLPDVIARSALPPARRFTLGAFYLHEGLRWQVIGVQRFEGVLHRGADGTAEPLGEEYTLWWLLNERRELAYLGDHGNKRFWREPRLADAVPGLADDPMRYGYDEWTLVDAVGEFSYRVTPGERHRSVERVPLYGVGVSVDVWLDERSEPRRIAFSRTRQLPDEEVLEGLGDAAGLASARRWGRGRDAGIAATLLALAFPVVSTLLPSPFGPFAGEWRLALPLALLSLVIAGVCAAREQAVTGERATLALAPSAQPAGRVMSTCGMPSSTYSPETRSKPSER